MGRKVWKNRDLDKYKREKESLSLWQGELQENPAEELKVSFTSQLMTPQKKFLLSLPSGTGLSPQTFGIGFSPQTFGIGFSPQTFGVGFSPQTFGTGFSPQTFGIWLGRASLSAPPREPQKAHSIFSHFA